jgi:hypothetical protein
MLWCAIAFVAGEAIKGILSVEGHHMPVAANFGQDRSSGNTQAETITAYDSLLWQGNVLKGDVAVYKEIFGRRRKGR